MTAQRLTAERVHALLIVAEAGAKTVRTTILELLENEDHGSAFAARVADVELSYAEEAMEVLRNRYLTPKPAVAPVDDTLPGLD